MYFLGVIKIVLYHGSYASVCDVAGRVSNDVTNQFILIVYAFIEDGAIFMIHTLNTDFLAVHPLLFALDAIWCVVFKLLAVFASS